MSIQAIRIEHSIDGLGVFRSEYGLFHNKNNYKYRQFTVNRHNNFPTPRIDAGIYRYANKDEFCAFKSLDQLNKWFTKRELKHFISLGFNIYSLDLKRCIIGEYQILFEKKNIINKNNISELFL